MQQEVEVVKSVEENGLKLITERQRQLIEQLVQSNRIEKVYQRYVQRALQNAVSSYSASKIIAFLVSLIAFKKDCVRPYHLKNGTRKSWKQKQEEQAMAEMAMCDTMRDERAVALCEAEIEVERVVP